MYILALCCCSTERKQVDILNEQISTKEVIITTQSYYDEYKEMESSVQSNEYADVNKSNTKATEKCPAEYKYNDKSGQYSFIADEDCFWNVESSDDAGFIMATERYSNNWELYQILENLIDKSIDYTSHVTNVGSASSSYEEARKGGFRPVEKDEMFGCRSMQELFSYYCSIYSVEYDLDTFCDKNRSSFIDLDGELCVSWFEGSSSAVLWSKPYRKIVIFDEDDRCAKFIISAPEEYKDDDGIWKRYYHFTQGLLVKADEGWRLREDGMILH